MTFQSLPAVMRTGQAATQAGVFEFAVASTGKQTIEHLPKSDLDLRKENTRLKALLNSNVDARISAAPNDGPTRATASDYATATAATPSIPRACTTTCTIAKSGERANCWVEQVSVTRISPFNGRIDPWQR